MPAQDDARLAEALRPVQSLVMGRCSAGPIQVVGISDGQPRLVSWQSPDIGAWQPGGVLPNFGWFPGRSLATVVDRNGNLVVFVLGTNGVPHIACVQRRRDLEWMIGSQLDLPPGARYAMVTAGTGRDGTPYLCGLTEGAGGIPTIIAQQDQDYQWAYGGPLAPSAEAGRYSSVMTVTSAITSPQVVA
ncbi:MAG: hypothetical protein ACRD3Q_09445, partial [Terriglobales bacterium]